MYFVYVEATFLILKVQIYKNIRFHTRKGFLISIRQESVALIKTLKTLNKPKTKKVKPCFSWVFKI